VAKVAPPAETAEFKRRRLRVVLRRTRQQADMTQHAAAKHLNWSTSKIVRIEHGDVPVTPTDVRALLSLYGVTDAERIEELVTLAIESREMRGFREYSDVYMATALELYGSEAAAQVIYKHAPTVIPGLLQTSDYARALLTSVGDSTEVVRRRMAAGAERQVILERTDRPELNFIIGEAALVRTAGSKEIMVDQIAALREHSRQKDINLLVLPFSAGTHPGLGEAFTILRFADADDLDDDLDVVYLENAERIPVSREGPEYLARYMELFVQLKKLAEAAGDFEVKLDEVVGSRFK
jgi:transcriptional regulator with XRE-family HTH domain